MSSKVEIVSRENLEKLHTKSLLSRLKKLQKCEDEIEWPPYAHKEQLENLEKSNFIEYKNTCLWRNAYQDLKDILSKREHILTAAERKKKRKRIK